MRKRRESTSGRNNSECASAERALLEGTNPSAQAQREHFWKEQMHECTNERRHGLNGSSRKQPLRKQPFWKQPFRKQPFRKQPLRKRPREPKRCPREPKWSWKTAKGEAKGAKRNPKWSPMNTKLEQNGSQRGANEKYKK